MNTIRKISVLLLVFIIWLSSSSFIPLGELLGHASHHLFKIGRSRDANEIWYSLNLGENGLPRSENPIRVFWVKKTMHNKIEPLTWVQKQYAYGIKWLNEETRKANEWRFQFVSYGKRTFILRKNSKNQFRVYTVSNNSEIEVSHIFVQIDGGSFWAPSISHVKLMGIEPHTGKQIAETIIP